MSKHCERCGAGELLLSPDSDGWWWAHPVDGQRWQLVHVDVEDDRVEPAGGFLVYEMHRFDRWQRIVPPAEPKEQR